LDPPHVLVADGADPAHYNESRKERRMAQTSMRSTHCASRRLPRSSSRYPPRLSSKYPPPLGATLLVAPADEGA
jgi:hypothetical protein